MKKLKKDKKKIKKLETVEMQIWSTFLFLFSGFCDIIVKKKKKEKLLCNTEFRHVPQVNGRLTLRGGGV